MTLFIILLIAIAVVIGVADIRQALITKPVFALFKRILPPMSQTEQEAMEAGSIWWEGELFRGNPDWRTLHDYPRPTLNQEEQDFLDNQVETLLTMLDDYKIVHEQKDLPKAVWDYLAKEGFFSMIIPKSYGGKDFSAIANSTIVARISTRSVSTAVTVMVPNSLGPGELLHRYGTEKQKKQWLPKLASGKEIPCFALTAPNAGSDAGAIPDRGIVCEGEFAGKKVIGLKLNWNKRYITLAPVATVLGLAFKMYDPDGLLGHQVDLGITCALIPTSHPGVESGARHLPVNMAFMNGTTRGSDVFIPLDWIIGGPEFAGKGWRMLVECLSAGRGISLPALATAGGHLAARTTGAYAAVRQQFGLSIGKFEGVQESLGRIGGLTYSLEAMRTMTAGAIDLGESPSVVTAMAKYHMTEMSRQIINDAMDVHAGKAVQVGPKNYLVHQYFACPIAITVEGANILTRNLMIFGQGATRCHPYVLAEMQAAANPDDEEGLKDFDQLLLGHGRYAVTNFFSALWQGVTVGVFNDAARAGDTSRYYQQLTRMSRALALVTDFAMLVLGGELKRREMLSARLGDVLSQLYIASCVLKRFESDGHQAADLPFVHWSVQHCLAEIGEAFRGFFANFPNRSVAWVLRLAIFPWGIHYQQPDDEYSVAISKTLMSKGVARDRISFLCYFNISEDDPVGVLEGAFAQMQDLKVLEQKINSSIRDGALSKDGTLSDMMLRAESQGIISSQELDAWRTMDRWRDIAMSVDEFAKDKITVASPEKKTRARKPRASTSKKTGAASA